MNRTLNTLTERLLAERNADGHWVGELSSSALSTATACIALTLAGETTLPAAALAWLERTQNTDGGWGDTVLSISNISTTALCWSAFAIAEREGTVASKAEAWLRAQAGSLEPRQLAQAIASRYGNDRTFSVPILTVLALARKVPWSIVPQLPFELAACPQSWFRWLQLPVVSYALPALIAIGHVHHRLHPTWNPLALAVRGMTAAATLRVLDRIQPPNGGFLEATPLTSFVAMSIKAAGYHDSPVLRRCLEFLQHSVLAGGSWPIDTNLATWVTTLSINALRGRLPAEDRAVIRQWLLKQQYRGTHPYTGAPPGGWAWTDLPGGVPDADDTSGALLALDTLGAHDDVDVAERGITWLLDLQNRDGGIPTFCRGWGKLPFDRSSQDITAHALQAWAAWQPRVNPTLQSRITAATQRAMSYLALSQRRDGAWVPLWFGNERAHNDENPVYGTSRVLLALSPESPEAQRATNWLTAAQNKDGGWGGDANIASSIEETSLAVSALSRSTPHAAKRGIDRLIEATHHGTHTPPTPIGFYFARLWYYERLYPLLFATDALRRFAQSQNAM
ncbi:MAG: squalene--hopene cyclase [Acidobacteria bacterium]|nr:squalene--hopene cyclase [Acidobacteriota bacterium]